MPLIKRYPNRKLYDTDAKQYVTLEQIAALIREGEDVQVVDYESGEDLTNLTLSQIILDQEKKQSGFLPRSLMTSLIRTGGETVDFVLHSLQGSLPASVVNLEERVNRLVAAGTLTAEQARQVLVALRAGELASVDENMASLTDSLWARLNIPTGRDVEELRQKLALLDAQLDALSQKRQKPDQMPDTE
jgi:polyhydroxyalkanoate synthesis repressor PhaR